jgi:hypothetical protein
MPKAASAVVGLALLRVRVRPLDGRRAERSRKTSPGRSKKSPGTMENRHSRQDDNGRLA